jgi:crotonobetainyl-CoA:carnitine CoA-transferase CaiB-like acyl-CoA transferase
MKDIFKGIKVLELANVLAGPSVGMFLAELGAEVIKVENPLTNGDVTRSWRLSTEDKSNDISSYFSCANWGKKSVALDISKTEGLQIVHQLVAKADIVISSYKPGDEEKFGLDYESLKNLNPAIILASISGYGSNNKRTAYDSVLQAETGFMSMNGTQESGPLKMPVAFIDLFAAHQLKEAILLAWIQKMKTGKGSHASVSLFDSALIALANQATNYLQAGYVPGLAGSLHPNIAPYGETFETKDSQHILLAVGSDKQFAELCKVLQLEHVDDDSKFSTNAARLRNREELQTILSAAIANWNSKELSDELISRNVPTGLVRNVAEALKVGHGLILQQDSYKGLPQTAFLQSDQLQRPPHFGEHTEEVLHTVLGFDNNIVTKLEAEGVIFQLPKA